MGKNNSNQTPKSEPKKEPEVTKTRERPARPPVIPETTTNHINLNEKGNLSKKEKKD